MGVNAGSVISLGLGPCMLHRLQSLLSGSQSAITTGRWLGDWLQLAFVWQQHLMYKTKKAQREKHLFSVKVSQISRITNKVRIPTRWQSLKVQITLNILFASIPATLYAWQSTVVECFHSGYKVDNMVKTHWGAEPKWSLSTSVAKGFIFVFQGELWYPRCLRKRECIVFLLLFPFPNQTQFPTANGVYL